MVGVLDTQQQADIQQNALLGPIIYLNMAGQSIVVLNTAQAAFDLFDSRGSNYTDRPKLIMAAEILAGNIHVGFVPHGPL